MGGWIKLYRDIQEHWIWKSDHRLKWWLDILLNVNHSDTKILIKGKLIECKRGQSVMSLETWAKRWNVSKKTVKDFFELLQKDSMLVYESIQISTRITVCNYDIYQNEVNAKETKGKRKVNAEETDTLPKQEGKEGIKNEKNVNNKPDKPDFINQIIQVFQECYFSNNQIEYVIINKEKERSCAGKLLGFYKKKHPDSNTEQTLEGFKKYFELVLQIKDDWIQKNMSIPIILSKFNEINNTLKNGMDKKSKGNPVTSDRELAQTFINNFGEQP